ncbi:hypothetical protein C8N24_5789 [Solirubrobacter pauli]|uniref:Uncharacterized protein n=1 Tax=Solirubrobacter pauli TaxID=166793 RepID=A0A660L864_9ACTN|nr:hypothetical protein [Solirubrobacter pauli]RKQ87760.1 hypothetical protein C8N24_5789 [Solirubrobacter pauli]
MPWLNRLGGLVLLGALLLPWYGERMTSVDDGDHGVHILVTELGSAWQAFSLFDVLLAALALAVVVAPRGRTVFGLVALVLVAHVLLDRPEQGYAPLLYGAWVGLAGAALAAVPQRWDARALATGLGGLALLVSLSARWYWAPWPDLGLRFPASDWDELLVVPHSAWDQLLVVDLALAALALLVLAAARSAKAQTAARAVGWVAIVLVAARIVFEPEETNVAYGAYVALVAATLAYAGTWVPRAAPA